MKGLHLKLLVVALIVVGLGLALYKTLVLGFPVVPLEDTDVWTVEVRVQFEGQNKSVKADLFIPSDPPNYSVLDENYASHGFGLTTDLEGDNRTAVWTIRRARGEHTLYYRVTLYRSEQGRVLDTEQPPYPKPRELEEPFASAVTTLVEEVRSKSADIATFTALLLKDINDPTPSENVALLLDPDPSPEGRLSLAIDVLAGARIPARAMHAVQLVDGAQQQTPVPYLEVYNGSAWLVFDPTTGETGLPKDMLIWWRGNEPLLSIRGAGQPEIAIAVARSVQQAVEVAQQRSEGSASRLLQFSLFSLPIQTQNVYKVLLLVPVGVFMIVVLRNIVGIQTFGTFMPVLIALAFRETELLWGIVLFSLIVALGLSIRFYLEHLKLLLVPRLAAVVIIVVLLMALLSVLTHKLGIDRGLSVALFPMVILAMTIERMSVVWEERGALDAIRQGVGSLVVAALAFLVMANEYVEHLVFVFPGLLLVLLALVLIVGRYTGYRLTELTRFKALTRSS